MAALDSVAVPGVLRREPTEELAATQDELRYLHHWVKNQLQFLSSTTFLARQQALSPEAVAALEACRARSDALGILHQTLYGNPLRTSQGFAACVQDLLNKLLPTAGAEARGLSAEVAGEDYALAPAEAGPCLLLINELVTNALQHAFPDGRSGTVRVMLQRGPNGRREILITDDGVGAAVGNGTWLGSGGLGLRLVAGLAQQLEARMEQPERQGENIGTVWRLILTEPGEASH